MLAFNNQVFKRNNVFLTVGFTFQSWKPQQTNKIPILFLSSSRTRVVCIKVIWFPAAYTGCNGLGSGLCSNVERGFDGMGILCVFCVYDTIGNRCFEKTSFPKILKTYKMYMKTLIYLIPRIRYLILAVKGQNNRLKASLCVLPM